MKRNPVVRDLIAKPRRNAGKHSDKRAVMIEDLMNVRAELEQEVRDMVSELGALVTKLNQVQSKIKGYEDDK
jgi:hypothetical protein